MDKLFEPHFRLEASRSRETGGIGATDLGLSVARTIVHAQGGTLNLTNRLEGGLRAVIQPADLNGKTTVQVGQHTLPDEARLPTVRPRWQGSMPADAGDR